MDDEEYNNVSWDIQAPADARTPYDLSGDVDPLSTLGEEMSKSFAEISSQVYQNPSRIVVKCLLPLVSSAHHLEK